MSSFDADVAAFRHAYADAIWTKDPAALIALYDPTTRVFDTWAAWSYESGADREPSVREWLTSLDAGERVRVTFDDVRTVAAGEMACVTAFVTYAAIDADERVLRSMQNRLTWVVSRRGGATRIVHEHTSVPIGDGLKAMLQRASG